MNASSKCINVNNDVICVLITTEISDDPLTFDLSCTQHPVEINQVTHLNNNLDNKLKPQMKLNPSICIVEMCK